MWKLLEISPINLVRPVVNDDANAFGLYPNSRAALSTLRRMTSEIEAPSVKVRDTAERDTPALSATSFNVTANEFAPSLFVLWPV